MNPRLKLGGGLVISLALVLLGAPPPQAPNVPALGVGLGSVEVLAPLTMPPVWMEGDRSSPIYLTVRVTDGSGPVSVYQALTDSNGQRAAMQVSPETLEVPEHAITQIEVRLTGTGNPRMKYSGKLLLQVGSSRQLTAVPIEVLPSADSGLANLVLWRGGLAALASIAFGAICLIWKGDFLKDIPDRPGRSAVGRRTLHSFPAHYRLCSCLWERVIHDLRRNRTNISCWLRFLGCQSLWRRYSSM